MCTNAYFGWRSAHYPFTYIIKKRWSCTKHCNSIAFLFLLPTDTMASSWMGMLEVSCCTRPCDGNVGTPDVALRTTIYVGRLPIYTTFHGYILLPWLIDSIFEKDSAELVKALMVGCFLFFFYYQCHFTWGFF